MIIGGCCVMITFMMCSYMVFDGLEGLLVASGIWGHDNGTAFRNLVIHLNVLLQIILWTLCNI